METDPTIITDYCGLVCGFLLADQQEILDHCIVHAKYDHDFALVMIDKLIAKCEEAKSLLSTGPETTKTTKAS